MTTTRAVAVPRGLVLRGRLWDGTQAQPGLVIIGADGRIAAAGPAGEIDPPPDVPTYGDQDAWVGPGLVDAHVHLAFGTPVEVVEHGVVAVRDLGSPVADLAMWRHDPTGLQVVGSGPILTALGGYPTTTWGAAGFGRGVGSREDARRATAELAQAGASLIKVALEPANGQPTPAADVVDALVDAAHEAGLAVTAHALTVAMVERALDAGVDELAHTPVEPLPAPVVEWIAAANTVVVSTLHALSSYPDSAVRENAAALVAAGVRLVYGSDLGNAGTRAGAEPRELRLLADSGLGMAGAIAAATGLAARTAGLRGRDGLGQICVGQPAALVVLASDPLADPEAWRQPRVVAIGRRVRARTVTG